MEYFRPRYLSDALSFLADQQARIVGGCTDVFAATTTPETGGGTKSPVLDVTAIEGLRGISDTGDYWRLGATTTWADIYQADLPPAFDALKGAAREIGSVQIQNSATIAGNLCNASPAADGVPPLLVLDAEVELVSAAGSRTLPLSRFLRGSGQTDLRDGELLGAVLVPKSAVSGQSGFLKLGVRKYLIISIVMVAARVVEVDGMIENIAISVGSCSPVAIRLRTLEAALRGQQVSLDLIERITDDLVVADLAPIDDVRASAAYRRRAAVQMVRRVVEQVSTGPGGGAL